MPALFCPAVYRGQVFAPRIAREADCMDRDVALSRIAAEARRLAAREPRVRAVLLAGSYARDTPWPGSDVDLLVVTETGSSRSEVSDVDWTTFDTTYSTLDEVERGIADSFVVCNTCLDLVVLHGELGIADRLMAVAHQLYGRHVPDAAGIAGYRRRLHTTIGALYAARAGQDPVWQAVLGGESVWLAGTILLATLAVGPIRADHWHAVLQTRAGELPFGTASVYAHWFVGASLEERCKSALTLAAGALGAGLTRVPAGGNPSPPPRVQIRAIPGAAEVVEMHRLIAAVGFGKMAKAEWFGDPVRQASEAGVIVWFAVPALLALGGAAMPDHTHWHGALQQVALPFDALGLYTHWLTGSSFAERKQAAMTLGRHTLSLLEPHFRDTPYARKYARPTNS